MQLEIPCSRSRFVSVTEHPANEADARPAGPRAAATSPARSLRLIGLRPAYAELVGEDRTLTTSSKEMTSWQTVSTAGFGLLLKASTRLVGSIGTAFPDFLFAILSFIATEFLLGCAAYAEAMYPGMAALNQGGDDPDPEGERGNPQQAPRQPAGLAPGVRPNLFLVARNDSFGDDSILVAARPQPVDVGCAADDNVAQPRPAQAARPGLRASIARLMTACLSGFRSERARRQAIMELRGLDDRVRRDIGISCCDIEYLASHGDPRE